MWVRVCIRLLPKYVSEPGSPLQQDVYSSTGLKIKSDLMDGNAVVMFAYGKCVAGRVSCMAAIWLMPQSWQHLRVVLIVHGDW